MLGALVIGGRTQHLVLIEACRTLFDYDSVTGDIKGYYARRAQALLTGWMRFETSPSDWGSLFTRVGARGCAVVLVLTSDGPQYW